MVGTLPLSLKYWYEEVGCTNLIGYFVSTRERPFSYRDGVRLDPLLVFSVEVAIAMVSTSMRGINTWHNDPTLSIAPDSSYKYGVGGDGPYSIALPCRAFDAPLLSEDHHTTFVNYLRICFRWGGFPGLERYKLLTDEEISFLTHDFLSF